MSFAQTHFPEKHRAISAGLEPKLPGGFDFCFDFGRLAGLLAVFFADFEAFNPAPAGGRFRGTRVA
jgi:hypothetical protein